MVTVTPSGSTTAAVTYTPIATNTLGSAAASVTFSNITGTYTDLVIIASVLGITGGAAGAMTNFLTFNGDTGANYSRSKLTGSSSSASTDRTSSANSMNLGNGNEANSNTLAFAPQIYHVFNYSNTTTYKTVLGRNNNVLSTGSRTAVTVGLWRSTAAITSITLSTDSSGGWYANSVFTLYGIGA